MSNRLHFNPNTRENTCFSCDFSSVGLPIAGECPNCAKLVQMRMQTQLMQEAANERKTQQEQEYYERQERALGPMPQILSDDFKSAALVGFLRLMAVFVPLTFVLPKKVEGFTMVLAFAVILGIDHFMPRLSIYTTLTPTARLVHWGLLILAIGSAVFG
jgi:hypothetical protein